MRARALEARHGWLWISEGWRLFRRQPVQYSTLLMTYILLAFGILMLQNGGTLAALLAFALYLFVPGLSVGFLEGARHAEENKPIYPILLIKAFTVSRSTTLALLALGAVQIISVESIFLLLTTQVLDLSDSEIAQIAAGQLTQENLGAYVRLYATIGCSALCVALPLWYAPVLISWHGLAPLKSMFFSIATVWRNRWAFVIYLAAWGGLVLGLPLVVVLLMQAVGLQEVAFLVLLPLMIALFGTLYCSHYATYRSVFRDDAETPR